MRPKEGWESFYRDQADCPVELMLQRSECGHRETKEEATAAVPERNDDGLGQMEVAEVVRNDQIMCIFKQ